MDGLTLVALILRRLRPYHKVDMYAEIGKAKKLMIAQFDNDIHLCVCVFLASGSEVGFCKA